MAASEDNDFVLVARKEFRMVSNMRSDFSHARQRSPSGDQQTAGNVGRHDR